MNSKLSELLQRLNSSDPLGKEELEGLFAEATDGHAVQKAPLAEPHRDQPSRMAGAGAQAEPLIVESLVAPDPIAAALDKAAVLSAFELEDLVPKGAVSVRVRSALLRETRGFTHKHRKLRYLSTAYRPSQLARLARSGRLAAEFSAARKLDKGPLAPLFSEMIITYGSEGLNGLIARLDPDPARDLKKLRRELRLVNWIVPARVDDFEDPHLHHKMGEILLRYQQAITVAETDARLAKEAARFIGRDALLKWLEDELFGSEKYLQPPIIALHGMGGIGKSAILAALIIRLRESMPDLLVTRIDFDRPGLAEADPGYLGNLVVRQIAAQSQITDTRLFTDDGIRQSSQQNTGLEGSMSSGFQSGEALHQVRAMSGPDRPLLVVLDTLEERQRHGMGAMTRLYDWLRSLSYGSTLGQVAILVAGRAKPNANQLEFPDHTPRELDELKPHERIELLVSLGHTAAGAELLAPLSGNPLLLHLLSRLVLQKGGPSAADLAGDGLGAAPAEALQAVIYDRILSHVADPEARKLAYPGLVLRHVTPDLVAKVIAPTILGEKVDETRARALFDALRREVWLVEEVTGDRVRHRTDVRRVMMRYLSQDGKMADIVVRIHGAAAAYFAINGPEAEEVYHRAMILPAEELAGLSFREATRWLEQIGADEDFLPPATHAVLRARAELTLSNAEIMALPTELAETYIEELGPDLVSREDLRRAVALGELSSRSGSYRWLQEARDGLGEWHQVQENTEPPLDGNFTLFQDGLTDLANLRRGAWASTVEAAPRTYFALADNLNVITKGGIAQNLLSEQSKLLRRVTYWAIAIAHTNEVPNNQVVQAAGKVLALASGDLPGQTEPFDKIEPDKVTVMEDHHRIWHLLSRADALAELFGDLAAPPTRSRFQFVPSLDWIRRAHWAAREAREYLSEWGSIESRLHKIANGEPFQMHEMTQDIPSDVARLVAKMPIAFRRLPVFQGTGFPEHRLPLRFALSEAIELRANSYLEVLELFAVLCAENGRFLPEELKPVLQPSFPTTLGGTDALFVPLLRYADQCALLPQLAARLVEKFPEAEKLARVNADLSRWAQVILPPNFSAEANKPEPL